VTDTLPPELRALVERLRSEARHYSCLNTEWSPAWANRSESDADAIEALARERDAAIKGRDEIAAIRERLEDEFEQVTRERDEALRECEEQARLNGMGGEREANLRAALVRAERERDDLAKLVREWICEECNEVFPPQGRGFVSMATCPRCKRCTLIPLAAHDIRKAEREREEALRDASAMAASQCQHAYGDEYGNQRCSEIDNLRASLARSASERDWVKQLHDLALKAMKLLEESEHKFAAQAAELRAIVEELAKGPPWSANLTLFQTALIEWSSKLRQRARAAVKETPR
jgi:hypothetical protein